MNVRRRAILLDEHIRDGMRLSTHGRRERAAALSDVLLTNTMLDAGLLDATAVPLAEGDVELARRAGRAHALALGVTLLLGHVIKRNVERPRPFVRDCIAEPALPGCRPASSDSFYSLHSAMAFTSAGFACAMRLSRSLFRVSGEDAGACGASLVMAAGTGLLRIASDRHYLSDVVIGAAMGLSVGYLFHLALVPARPRLLPWG